ncbi:phosphate signaling complex protein PhoU [Flavobacterium sp.]|uniref:phosphate signaling complex protein PhoU n=1 Tax=Flavobacterium sp. TaxID=239 RepID=UPI003D095FFF
MILETEITKLRNAIIKIINLAENQVVEAMNVMAVDADKKAKGVKKVENKIDKLDVKIDEICQNIFALQQPVASDLRFIMSAMQISNEAERIGDLSLSIIKKAKTVKEQPQLLEKFNIDKLTEDVKATAYKTLEAFENLNEENINEVFALNKKVRHTTEELIQDIISEMQNNTTYVVAGTHLVMTLKHIDRITSHCANIVESVYFMINAKIIKNDKN